MRGAAQQIVSSQRWHSVELRQRPYRLNPESSAGPWPGKSLVCLPVQPWTCDDGPVAWTLPPMVEFSTSTNLVVVTILGSEQQMQKSLFPAFYAFQINLFFKKRKDGKHCGQSVKPLLGIPTSHTRMPGSSPKYSTCDPVS